MMYLVLWGVLMSLLLSAVHLSVHAAGNQTSTVVADVINRRQAPSNTLVPFNDEFDLLEGDLLIPRVVKTMPSLALHNNLRYWRNFRNGKYEVPYNSNFPSPKAKKVVEWAFRYIEMGSNLLFRPSHSGDTHRIVITDHEKGCVTHLPYGQENVAVNLNSTTDFCYEPGSVVHELLHALGFIHEHGRPDRGLYIDERYIGAPKNDAAYGIVADSTIYTPFDFASIMLYSLGTYTSYVTLKSFNEADEWKYKGQKMFLSSCDWHALNTVYPGDRLPPPCIPGEVPDYLDPVDPYDDYQRSDCRYKPLGSFFKGLCRFRNGKDFPDLDFIPTKSGSTSSTTTTRSTTTRTTTTKTSRTTILSSTSTTVSAKEEDSTTSESDDATNGTDDTRDEGVSHDGEESSDGNGSSDDDGTNGTITTSNVKTSLRSYCSRFVPDPGETSEGCFETCLGCGDVWQHNLTKTNVRRCVDELNAYCHIPGDTPPRPLGSSRTESSQSGALLLIPVLTAWHVTVVW